MARGLSSKAGKNPRGRHAYGSGPMRWNAFL